MIKNYLDLLEWIRSPRNKKKDYSITIFQSLILQRLLKYSRQNQEITYSKQIISEHMFRGLSQIENNLPILTKKNLISTKVSRSKDEHGNIISKRVIRINWDKLHVIKKEMDEYVNQELVEDNTKDLTQENTQHRYLIRDIMYCSCGTPIGGRTKPERSIYHYYCPESERNFNKSIPSENVCTMKRCVNIQPTEELVWNTLKGLLKNTVHLKTHLNSVLKENPDFSVMVRKQRYKLTRKLKELKNELKTISDGIVELEKKRILNHFKSDEIYLKLKRELDDEYRKTHVKIENTNNLLNLHYQKDKWYSSLENISELITSKKTFSFKEKKTLTHLFIHSITLSHDNKNKVHEITLFLKIPLVFGHNKTQDLKNVPIKNTSVNLTGQQDQPDTLWDYSTVTDFAKFLG